MAAGVFRLEEVPRMVSGAYLLEDAGHTWLKVTRVGDALEVQLPEKALDPVATVLVLETK